MYYSNEDIDAFVGRLKTPAGDEYVKQAALTIGDMLVKRPDLYKTFGVYWWAMKSALKKHHPGDAWFKGDYFDQLMYDRAWHGSLFKTVLAAAVYHAQHDLVTSAHDWIDSHGEERQYTLIDEDAGF